MHMFVNYYSVYDLQLHVLLLLVVNAQWLSLCSQVCATTDVAWTSLSLSSLLWHTQGLYVFATVI